MEITAAVLRTNDGPSALEPVELAEPRAAEVLVRVVGAGMCHTDVIPRGAVSFSPPPIITGPARAGVVGAGRADVEGIAVRQPVALPFHSRGTCTMCLHGLPAPP